MPLMPVAYSAAAKTSWILGYKSSGLSIHGFVEKNVGAPNVSTLSRWSRGKCTRVMGQPKLAPATLARALIGLRIRRDKKLTLKQAAAIANGIAPLPPPKFTKRVQ